MQRIAIFVIFLGFLSNSSLGSALDDPKTETMVKEEIQTITAAYLKYVNQYIIPALQQGAGGTSSKAIAIPPIFDPGYRPNPQMPPQLETLLEPIGRAVAYAGLLCKGVGLSKGVEMDEVYVSFPSFSRKSAKVGKQFLSAVLGTNVAPGQDVDNHTSTTTIQCKTFLKKVCTSGACNSGKCGYSKALGAACINLCEEDNLLAINTCLKDFYRGQVVPQSAVKGIAPQEGGQNFVSHSPQGALLTAQQQRPPAYGPQYPQQGPAYGQQQRPPAYGPPPYPPYGQQGAYGPQSPYPPYGRPGG